MLLFGRMFGRLAESFGRIFRPDLAENFGRIFGFGRTLILSWQFFAPFSNPLAILRQKLSHPNLDIALSILSSLSARHFFHKQR